MKDEEVVARLQIIGEMSSDTAVQQLTKVLVQYIKRHSTDNDKPGFAAGSNTEDAA